MRSAASASFLFLGFLLLGHVILLNRESHRRIWVRIELLIAACIHSSSAIRFQLAWLLLRGVLLLLVDFYNTITPWLGNLLLANYAKISLTLCPLLALVGKCSAPTYLAYAVAISSSTFLLTISHLLPAIIIGAPGRYFSSSDYHFLTFSKLSLSVTS